MANIFKESLDVKEHPNRNNHDLTHKVHGSYKMGILYPFLCKKVVPGDSFRIDTACSFQANAMPFPTQSNVRAIFHYFYVRNKNIWENWTNWLEGLEEHTPPYINRQGDFYKTGTLPDYLGVSTTLEKDGNLTTPFGFHFLSGYRPVGPEIGAIMRNFYYFKSGFVPVTDIDESSGLGFLASPVLSVNYSGTAQLVDSFVLEGITTQEANLNKISLSALCFRDQPDLTDDFLPSSLREGEEIFRPIFPPDNGHAISLNKQSNVRISGSTFIFNVDSSTITTAAAQAKSAGYNYFVLIAHYPKTSFTTPSLYTNFQDFFVDTGRSRLYVENSNPVVDIADFPEFSPYFYDGFPNDDYRVISALPFRAYESIYYAYYSNSVMQPLVVNGKKRYNRYNTALDDGADNTEYHLFHRNWELDAYTSCLPSPMQGNMPLVGMNVLGNVTLEDPESGAITTAHANVEGEDVSIQVTSPIQSVEHGRTLVNLLNTGFSIPDFREANALTRFLEQGLRSGYRYVDWIHGQTGVKPKYNELDMPEFLGGFSTKMNVNKVTNTNGDGETPLGAYAANGSLFGGSKHGITRFFDDYGFIIGIMCLVPDNAYSQILPSEFRMDSRLDNYFPVFSQTNYQPITYEEFCPIQSHYEYLNGDTKKKLTDTFGYQRPNHDLVWYPDTVHGDLRLSLRDIVVNRVFKNRPELSREFLEINDKDASRIFSVTREDEDNFIGEIVIKISAKRPVPRVFVPSLGR